jgi:hypothetical protein
MKIQNGLSRTSVLMIEKEKESVRNQSQSDERLAGKMTQKSTLNFA